MATRARTVCRFPGCGVLVEQPGYCLKHAKVVAQRTDERRGTAHERGYGKKWQKARETYLQHHPLCVMCEEEGRVTAATDVDHIILHRLKAAKDSGDVGAIARAQSLFWDQKNWQALCKTHHSQKTAREDGGFGMKRGGTRKV